MLNDLRYGMRALGRTPGFLSVAVATLALGIGGTSAVFSLFRAVFLNPLPFPDADRLVTVSERRGSSRDTDLPVSGHEYVAWKEQTRVIENMALFRGERLNLTGIGEPLMIEAVRASGDYFDVLEWRAAIGRVFGIAETGAGSDRVVVLGDGFWRRRFSADAAIVGQDIWLNDQAYRVIGIMPPLPASLTTDVLLPLDVVAQARAVGRHNLGVVGRLKPGITPTQAQAELQGIAERLARDLPRDNTDHNVNVQVLRENLVGGFRTAWLLLMAAIGFVLLIACANLANLLLTRGASRQKEMAVRAALGATRSRLVRQLLLESVLLAMLGGSAGLLLAAWMVDLFASLAAVRVPLLETARVDATAIGITALLSLLTGIATGVAPAWRASRFDTRGWLAEGHRMSTDRARQRLGAVLVASQVAWTVILLVGAGLMLNSFVRLVNVDPGFTTKDVLVIPVDLPASHYPEPEQRRAFFDELLRRLRGLPGISAEGAVTHLPLGGSDNWMRFNLVGHPAPPPGQELNAAFRVATPDYFRVLGVPLRSGRFFSDADARISVPVIRWFPQQPFPPGFDRPQPRPVALISEAAARQFWPNEDPVGQQIRVLFSPEITVIGVVGDVKHNALNMPSYPHIYLPHNQEPWSSFSFVVRTSLPPSEVVPAVREQVRAIDTSLPVTVRPMQDIRSDTLTERRFYLLLIGAFGLVALGLAAVGIFGVVSHAVTQRTMEIGVRMALGAQYREIIELIASEGIRPVLAGLVAGTSGGLVLARFIEKLLYGVRPADPLTFLAVAGSLTAIALIACWIPARRAARLDPVAALRSAEGLVL